MCVGLYVCVRLFVCVCVECGKRTPCKRCNKAIFMFNAERVSCKSYIFSHPPGAEFRGKGGGECSWIMTAIYG